MNTSFFIAKKLIKGDLKQNKISKPIVNISIASIVIGVAIMIISISIITGFQQKIREKVIGFGSHIQIVKFEDNQSMESSPILKKQDFLKELMQNENIKHVQNFAYKPAIIQTDFDTAFFKLADKDTFLVNKNVHGVLFKGIDDDYDWSFFNDKIVKGKIPDSTGASNEILISEYVFNLLNFELDDEVNAYFIDKNSPKKRSFIIKGVYKTGLEDFDKKIIFTQLKEIQKINNWGVQSYLTLRDSCVDYGYILEVKAFGTTGTYLYNWGDEDTYYNSYYLNGKETDSIHVKVIPVHFDFIGNTEGIDTLINENYAKIVVDKPCICTEEILAKNPIEYISDDTIKTPFGYVYIVNGQGTSHHYTGGFEVLINEWNDLEKMDEIIYEFVPMDLKTETIVELNPEIFNWLGFLDMNVYVILFLMIFVSIINMITSLLVLIIEKTNTIGILKAIGTKNWTIRKVFLFQSFILLSKGLLIGNVLGIGLLYLQKYTEFMKLDAQVYYVDVVPVHIDIKYILFVNFITIISCMMALILPSIIISRIKPIKAIKFN